MQDLLKQVSSFEILSLIGFTDDVAISAGNEAVQVTTLLMRKSELERDAPARCQQQVSGSSSGEWCNSSAVGRIRRALLPLSMSLP